MKTLVLSNGSSYEFTDDSHITHLVTDVNSFTLVDAIVANITEENLAGATFDGVVVENMIPETCTAKSDLKGSVTVTIITRSKTEIEMMKNEITELQEALAEIAGGM